MAVALSIFLVVALLNSAVELFAHRIPCNLTRTGALLVTSISGILLTLIVGHGVTRVIVAL